MFKRIVSAVVVSAAFLSQAQAASFNGEFWDSSSSISSLSQALGIINSRSADATFQSTAIDYPNASRQNVSSNTVLFDYLGVDGYTLSGEHATRVTTSVFRFSGFLDLTEGEQTFKVGSDDGFELSIDGDVISSYTRNRGFRTTTTTVDAGLGITPFQLIYWENHGNTGVEFRLDNQLAEASLAALQGAPAAPAVPLPAGLALMLGGLGVLGVIRGVKRA